MLQKELAKRLRGRFETEPDGDGWLAVSSDGMPLCQVKYNGNCIVNDYAEYRLGKIYLYGKDIPRDTDTAMYYLHLAAEHGNQYAAQLIHSIKVNGNGTAALASLRLLGHMARIIQNRLEDERKSSLLFWLKAE